MLAFVGISIYLSFIWMIYIQTYRSVYSEQWKAPTLCVFSAFGLAFVVKEGTQLEI